jgi:hypothetical protein
MLLNEKWSLISQNLSLELIKLLRLVPNTGYYSYSFFTVCFPILYDNKGIKNLIN